MPRLEVPAVIRESFQTHQVVAVFTALLQDHSILHQDPQVQAILLHHIQVAADHHIQVAVGDHILVVAEEDSNNGDKVY